MTENPENSPNPASPAKKANFGKVAGGIAGFVIAYVLAQFVASSFFKKPSVDEALTSVASEINKSCPIVVDAETRLDNCGALPNKVFRYNYTLVNYVKDSINIGVLEENLQPSLINSVKTSPDMKFQRDNNVTLSYYYKDKAGIFLLDIEVTPDLYK